MHLVRASNSKNSAHRLPLIFCINIRWRNSDKIRDHRMGRQFREKIKASFYFSSFHVFSSIRINFGCRAQLQQMTSCLSRLHLFIRGGVEPRTITVHYRFGVVGSYSFNGNDNRCLENFSLDFSPLLSARVANDCFASFHFALESFVRVLHEPLLSKTIGNPSFQVDL